MIWKRCGVVALVLVLLIALTPAPPRAGVVTGTAQSEGIRALVAYVGCAGGIIIAVSGAGVFAAGIACAYAFFMDD